MRDVFRFGHIRLWSHFLHASPRESGTAQNMFPQIGGLRPAEYWLNTVFSCVCLGHVDSGPLATSNDTPSGSSCSTVQPSVTTIGVSAHGEHLAFRIVKHYSAIVNPSLPHRVLTRTLSFPSHQLTSRTTGCIMATTTLGSRQTQGTESYRRSAPAAPLHIRCPSLIKSPVSNLTHDGHNLPLPRHMRTPGSRRCPKFQIIAVFSVLPSQSSQSQCFPYLGLLRVVFVGLATRGDGEVRHCVSSLCKFMRVPDWKLSVCRLVLFGIVICRSVFPIWRGKLGQGHRFDRC